MTCVSRLVTVDRLREPIFPLVLGSAVDATARVRGGLVSGSGKIKYKYLAQGHARRSRQSGSALCPKRGWDFRLEGSHVTVWT